MKHLFVFLLAVCTALPALAQRDQVRTTAEATLSVRGADAQSSSSRTQLPISANGPAALTRILTEGATVDGWYITVSGDPFDGSSEGPCLDLNGDVGQCFVSEPGLLDDLGIPNSGADNAFDNLSVSTSSNGRSIILEGSFIAQFDSDIGEVGSNIVLRRSSGGRTLTDITFSYIDPLIGVTAGQTVDVRIEISFE